jgi:DNA-binding MarR family transcriptional regulator
MNTFKSTLYSTNRVNSEIKKYLGKEFRKAKIGISLEDYYVLAAYKLGDSNLYNREKNEKTLLSRLTQKMVNDGLLVKEKDKIDTRRNVITFTNKGNKVYETANKIYFDLNSEYQKHFASIEKTLNKKNIEFASKIMSK